ncbi:MAG: alpha/beta hydrolase [Bdellovibrionales bacterium]|nr:alpha/beta hydrolase [Bdellovibrionales bacterium]
MKIIAFFILCIQIAFSFIAQADVLSDYCKHENIRSIQVPISYSDLELGHFTFRYQLVEGNSNRSIPVVIYLPGGPGGDPGISSDPDSMMSLLPKSLLNRVFTDQRSTYCNKVDPSIALELSTKSLANDVIEILKDLKKRGFSEFVLYGHSFGTVHATEVANLIANDKSFEGPKLKALVLEAVVGDTFSKGETQKDFNEILLKILARGDSRLQTILSASPLPLEETQEKWANAIYTWLYFGITQNPFFPDVLMKLAPLLTGDKQGLASLKGEIHSSIETQATDIFKQIACSEITEDYGRSKVMVGGQIVLESNDCNGRVLNNPFDPSKYRTTAPTLYIQGDLDPATPLEKANKHFQNFSAPFKQMLLVRDAGHIPLGIQLYRCKSKIFNDILMNAKVFSRNYKIV